MKAGASKTPGWLGALSGVPLLSMGFRTFFALASGYGALTMALWLVMMGGWSAPSLAMPAANWHAHEMLFGFAAAGLAGFLLTAVPNWTGRQPLQGWPLAALAGLWLAGRLALGLGSGLPPAVVAVVDIAFLPVLLAVVAADIIAAGNRRNYGVIAVVALLIVANGLIYSAAFAGGDAWLRGGERLAVNLFAVLITLIGGRIVPAFTGNWMAQAGRPGRPAPFGLIDKLTLGAMAAAALVDAAAAGTPLGGALWLAAGALHLLRLSRWRGLDTLGEPIVWVLHLGYLWLAVGSILLGVAAWGDVAARMAGVHALTAGAIGTMLVAVMSRASLGHSGRPLKAGPGTAAAYLLVTLAAVSRILAPWWDAAWWALTTAAAVAWIGAWALFFGSYLSLWTRPRGG